MPESTIDPDSVLTAMQDDVRDHLAADTYYSGIDIFTPDDMTEDGKPQAVADIQQRVLQSLAATSKGICVIVSAPALSVFSTDAPGVYADNLALLVRIVESPTINRGATGTRKTAGQLGMHTLRRLWHHTFLGWTFVPVRAGLVPSDLKAGTMVWDITYRTKLDLSALSTEES